MEGWLFWLLVAVIFGIGEIATTGLFLGPFAVGAALAALADAVGAPFVVDLVVFLAVSVVVLAALRPVARRHLRQPARLRTGTAALVGHTATVLERIDNAQDAGQVRLDGEVWRARAFDDDEVFEPGARVQVIEIRGVTALVTH
jgi:membrane protein implicated in regulation of membrane protease activity